MPPSMKGLKALFKKKPATPSPFAALAQQPGATRGAMDVQRSVYKKMTGREGRSLMSQMPAKKLDPALKARRELMQETAANVRAMSPADQAKVAAQWNKPQEPMPWKPGPGAAARESRQAVRKAAITASKSRVAAGLPSRAPVGTSLVETKRVPPGKVVLPSGSTMSKQELDREIKAWEKRTKQGASEPRPGTADWEEWRGSSGSKRYRPR